MCYATGFANIEEWKSSMYLITCVTIRVFLVTEIRASFAIHDPARRMIPSLKTVPIGFEPPDHAPLFLSISVVIRVLIVPCLFNAPSTLSRNSLHH